MSAMMTAVSRGVRWQTWLQGFSWTGSDSVQDTCAHETAVGRRCRPPNHTDEADYSTPYQDCATSVVGGNWHPK